MLRRDDERLRSLRDDRVGAPEERTEPAAVHIEVRGLEKSYRSASGTLTALQDVDLAIARGEFVSFLGPSGCGKSTFLMILAGLVAPSAGHVAVSGRRVERPLTNVGIAFQQDLLMDWRTVIGNVLLQADVRGLDRDATRLKAMNLLEQVGLRGFEERRPWELSGGMRQRVALCRALIHDADLLLLDEPFGALDALTRDGIHLDLLRICGENRRTSVLITHSIAEAVFLSDRVFVMSARPGRVALEHAIDLPRPRTAAMRDGDAFARHQAVLRKALGS